MKKQTLQEVANNMGGYASLNQDGSILVSDRKPVADKQIGEWTAPYGDSCIINYVKNLKNTGKVWNHSICTSY